MDDQGGGTAKGIEEKGMEILKSSQWAQWVQHASTTVAIAVSWMSDMSAKEGWQNINHKVIDN